MSIGSKLKQEEKVRVSTNATEENDSPILSKIAKMK